MRIETPKEKAKAKNDEEKIVASVEETPAGPPEHIIQHTLGKNYQLNKLPKFKVLFKISNVCRAHLFMAATTKTTISTIFMTIENLMYVALC